jgi:hypothetical protein
MELDFLWESFGAGDLPYPLRLRSHGETASERAALRDQTFRQLSASGVIDDEGDLRADLILHLEALAASEVWVDSVHLPERDSVAFLARAASVDGRGSLALQDERGVSFSEIPGDSLVSSVVGLLPAASRGAQRSVTLPLEELMDGPGADFLRRKAAGGAVSSADEDRKLLAQLHAQQRLRGGQIGASSRDGVGGKTRSPVLSWFDTESGRYMTRATAGADGTQWVTVAPADAATLRHAVSEMLARVQAGAGV